MEFKIYRSSNKGPSILPTTDRIAIEPCRDLSFMSKHYKIQIVWIENFELYNIRVASASLRIVDVFTSKIQFVGIKC